MNLLKTQNIFIAINCMVLLSSCKQELLGWQHSFDLERDKNPKTIKTLEVLDAQQGQYIADIGAGFGYYTFKLSEIVGPKGLIVATDSDQECIDHMKQVKDEKYQNVKVVKVTLDKHSIPEKYKFNKILMVNSVNFKKNIPFKKHKEYICNLSRLLKPQGFVVYTIDYTGNMDYSYQEIVKLFTSNCFSHIEDLSYTTLMEQKVLLLKAYN